MIKEWVKEELQSIDIGDKRLNKRTLHLLTAASSQPQASLNTMFHSRKEVQACYRFFSNNLITQSKLISPHIAKTVERAANYPVVLILSDTTSLNYTTRKTQKDSGYISSNNAQGFFLHAGVAVTPERLHLGVVRYKLWSREKEKPEKILHRDYRNLEEKESYRWLECYRNACQLSENCKDTQFIHISDREGDIFEIYEEYKERNKNGKHAADLIIRSNHNRVCNGGKIFYATKIESLESINVIKNNNLTNNFSAKLSKNQDIFRYMIKNKDHKFRSSTVRKTGKIYKRRFKGRAKKESVLLYDRLQGLKTLAEISFQITKRNSSETRIVRQSVRASSVTLKSKDEEVQVNAIYLEEIDPPEGEKPVIWRLLTTLPIYSIEEIMKVIKYYLCRWEIEIFFKTYKSGCKIEARSLQDASRLYPLFCLFLIVAWRINYLLHMARIAPEMSCEAFFEPSEWKAGYVAATRDRQYPSSPPSMKEMIEYIGKLGGHLGRKSDPRPGPKAMWIGICKLAHYADAWDLFGPEVRHA